MTKLTTCIVDFADERRIKDTSKNLFLLNSFRLGHSWVNGGFWDVALLVGVNDFADWIDGGGTD